MDNLSTQNGVIMFSDLKDFTLKTSLLTQKQIDKILDDQDKLMLLNLKKYNGNLIKTIGDSYMIFFENALNALFFSIEIQKLLIDYNKEKTLLLNKIEIRISLDYGTLNKKNTINGHDYFGDSVNLSSRVLSRTLENKIFITDKFYNNVKNEKINCRFDFLGDTTFKGILYNVGIYEVIYKDDEIILFDKGVYNRIIYDDILIDEKTKKRIKNIDDIIFKSSSVNTILGIQPIPFFDIYSSITVYTYMLNQIAGEYNIKLSTKQIKEIIITILTAIGGSLAIGQAISGISKIGLIGIAGFLFIPLNFATTYGIGKVMNSYFYYQTKSLKLNNSDIKKLFLSSKDDGLRYAKQNRKEILKVGREFKKYFTNYINDSKNDLEKIKKEIKDLKNN